MKTIVTLLLGAYVVRPILDIVMVMKPEIKSCTKDFVSGLKDHIAHNPKD